VNGYLVLRYAYLAFYRVSSIHCPEPFISTYQLETFEAFANLRDPDDPSIGGCQDQFNFALSFHFVDKSAVSLI